MLWGIGGSCFIYVGNLFTDGTDVTTLIVPIIFAVADISADISIGNLARRCVHPAL